MWLLLPSLGNFNWLPPPQWVGPLLWSAPILHPSPMRASYMALTVRVLKWPDSVYVSAVAEPQINFKWELLDLYSIILFRQNHCEDSTVRSMSLVLVAPYVRISKHLAKPWRTNQHCGHSCDCSHGMWTGFDPWAAALPTGWPTRPGLTSSAFRHRLLNHCVHGFCPFLPILLPTVPVFFFTKLYRIKINGKWRMWSELQRNVSFF